LTSSTPTKSKSSRIPSPTALASAQLKVSTAGLAAYPLNAARQLELLARFGTNFDQASGRKYIIAITSTGDKTGPEGKPFLQD
jgi:hypothetical protein